MEVTERIEQRKPLKPPRKNKLISFRVSEKEYDNLLNLCGSGATVMSVSTFVRSAIRQLLANQPDGSLNSELDGFTSPEERADATKRLIESMERLGQVINRLTDLMEHTSHDDGADRQGA